MPYLNQIIVLGHLGKDAETRFSDSGLAITSFSVATSYGKEDGKKTTWHRVVGFDLPQFVLDGLKKGELVLVNGRQEHSEYTDKEGVKRLSAQIVANLVQTFKRSEQPETVSEPEAPVVKDNNDLPF